MSGDSKPVLVGVILDVSNSMQKNWRNRSGKEMPRFDVVREVLNEQLWKISSMSASREKQVEVFCLGMGLQKTVTFAKDNPGDNKEERQDDEELLEIHQSNLVCDLLALSEIAPTITELKFLESSLNHKWNMYAEKILARTKQEVEEDVYGQLKDYIRVGLYQSARDRLYTSWQYRLYLWLQSASLRQKSTYLRRIFDKLVEHVNGWEEKIDASCSRESARYFDNIANQVRKLFEENQEKYAHTIKDMLQDFAAIQIQIILELLTAGHTTDRVLDYFDEVRAFRIAEDVYSHLNNEIERQIRIPLIRNLAIFLKDMRFELRASLDRHELKQLTEKCIQKHAWEVLEPFVREVVFNLVQDCFTQKAEKMMLYWVTIASSREVVQPVQEIKAVLPEVTHEEVLRSKYMFGTTPIKEALNLASMRLLNPRYQDCKKSLVIISDGEFEIDVSVQSLNTPVDTLASLLKQAGVNIVSLYVQNRNIVNRLVLRVSSHWPEGAKTMFEIASEVAQDEEFVSWVKQYNHHLPVKSKLFLQINESELLHEIFDGIFKYES